MPLGFQSHIIHFLFPAIIFFVLPISSQKITLTFFRNGYHVDGFTQDTYREQKKESIILVLKKEAPQLFVDSITNYVIFNVRGEVIKDFKSVTNNTQLWLVPSGRYFIWPHVRVGHRVNISVPGYDSTVSLESLSESPRVFYLHNFFSEEEANALIDNALSINDEGYSLMRSTTGAQLRQDRTMSDESTYSSIRTSENAWDQTSEWSVALMKRAFALLRIRYHFFLADGLQILHYLPGQAYAPHHDWFPENSYGTHNFDPKSGGTNRYATVFVYLSDVDVGGQTVFPFTDALTESEQNALSPEAKEAVTSSISSEKLDALVKDLFPTERWESQLAKLCHQKLSIKPKKARAILFYDMTPEWDMDQASMHGACPVLSGEKWGANIWVWNGRRYGFPAEAIPPVHEDL